MTAENLEVRTNKLAKVLRCLKPLAWPVTGPIDAIKDVWHGIGVLRPKEGLEGKVRNFFSTATKTMMAAAGVVLGVPLNILHHELMHSVTAKVAGSQVYDVGISEYFGGKVFALLPGISEHSKFFGGTLLSEDRPFYVVYAPQLLAIPGIYMLAKGIKNKNPFLTGFGGTFAFAGIVHACGYSGDMKEIIEKIGIGNSSLGFCIGLGIAGATYAFGKKITEYVCKLEDYIERKIAKPRFTTPALIAAMTGALLFAGQPDTIRSYIPSSKPEQIVASMTKLEKSIITGIINGKQTLDEALAEQDAGRQTVIAQDLTAYLQVKEPEKALKFIRPLYSKKLIRDADVGDFIKASYLGGADPDEIMAAAEIKPGMAKYSISSLMIENKDERIADFAKKHSIDSSSIAHRCANAFFKGKITLEDAKKATTQHNELYRVIADMARTARNREYATRAYDTAIKHAEMLLSLPNALPEDFTQYANVLYQKGERERAKKFIDEVKTKDPQNAKIYDRLTSHWK